MDNSQIDGPRLRLPAPYLSPSNLDLVDRYTTGHTTYLPGLLNVSYRACVHGYLTSQACPSCQCRRMMDWTGLDRMYVRGDCLWRLLYW